MGRPPNPLESPNRRRNARLPRVRPWSHEPLRPKGRRLASATASGFRRSQEAPFHRSKHRTARIPSPRIVCQRRRGFDRQGANAIGGRRRGTPLGPMETAPCVSVAGPRLRRAGQPPIQSPLPCRHPNERGPKLLLCPP